MKKFSKSAAIVAIAATLSAAGAVGLLGAQAQPASAESTALAFSSDNWVVKSGSLDLNGQTSVTTDKDAQSGAGKLLVSTNREYSDFHLQYKVQYDAANTHGDPWDGYGGILLHGDRTASGPDGYYIGFYGWNGGAQMYVATGYWRADGFSLMFGNDSGWGGNVGFNEHTIDVYVKDSHLNILINGWLFENAALPYTQSGVISIYSDGITCKFSDITVEPLGADFDITSTLIRHNWTNNDPGSNITGDMWYWNDSGKDQTFKMRLPDASEGATNYYLARRSKVYDGNQSVDVYVDKTGTLGLSDDWSATEKAVTWGDRANEGRGIFGINSVEIPASSFDGATPGEKVGFYLDKNIVGWYSAAEYWLLYKDKNGVLRVADYMDLVYAFDRSAHSFDCADANSYEKGYHFISQDKEMITSHRRGQEVAWLKMPTVTKIGDIEHTFEYDDTALDVRIAEFVDIQTNHFKCKIEYSVDGGEFTTALPTLASATATGKITVRVSAAGVANDKSGAISFEPVTAEINYSTIKNDAPSAYLYKTKDISVNSTGDGAKLDLRDFVSTNMEGDWSYALDGVTTAGSEFTIPSRNIAGGKVTVTLTPESGEALSCDIPLDVKYYQYKQAIDLSSVYYENGAAPSDKWLALYGEVKTESGKWVSDAQNVWGIMTDFGADSYSLRLRMDIKETADVENSGLLVHASIGTCGYNGLLVRFYRSGNDIYLVSGWLVDGKYVSLNIGYYVFGNADAGDFYVNVISQGSAVVVMLNGWRMCTISDRYFSGGKFAILGGGADCNFYDLQCAAFNDDIAHKVGRMDWDTKGSDTFAYEACWNSALSVDLALPEEADVSGYKLVSRTFLDGSTPTVTAEGKDFSYAIPSGGSYADVALDLPGISPSGKLTVTVTPTSGASFYASFMTLLYQKGGEWYVADSVYFANGSDSAAHNATAAVEYSVRKQHIPMASGILMTSQKGEKAVWASNVAVVDKMTAKTYEDAEISSAMTLPYRLYLPEGYDESKEYPVMLFMHGAGERGTDNALQITNIAGVSNVLIDRLVFGEYKDKFIIVAPQCPANMRWVENDWTPGEYDFDGTEQSIPSMLVQSLMLKEIFEKYSVDRSRVYGAGVSMGGFGITDLAMRAPDMFAAILNVCGGCDPTKADLLSTTAVRGFHSPSDTTVNGNALKTLLSAASVKGFDVRYNEIGANIGHLEWVPAFEEPDLIAWLLARQKTWTVSIELGGGALADGVSVPETYGYTAAKYTLPTPVKDGYGFGGWYETPEFTGSAVTEFDGSAARDLRLYAHWIKDCTVTVKDGEEVLDTRSVHNGDVLDLSQYSPEKSGYVLMGWTDGENDYSIKGKITVESDITLTAKWAKAKYAIAVYDGDRKIFDASVDHGGNIEFTPPNIEGYEFAGLFSDAECIVAATMPATATADLTLYAKYTPKPNAPATADDGEKTNLGLAVGLPLAIVGALGVAAAAFVIVKRKKRNAK